MLNRTLRPLFLALLAALTVLPRIGQAEEHRVPIVILVSIDGFRADYLDREITPNLLALAQGGIHAVMRPSFPSKTFPNHWTLVTGQRPDRHGIVANRMEDPARPGEVFTMASEDPFWWSGATPIWIEAEQAGIRTATVFWPGSPVPFVGKRPSDWHQYHQAIDNVQRVNAVLDLVRRPAAIRPRFISLYFDTVDTAGHHFGPDDQRTNAALAEVDARIGDLRRGLAEMEQPANLVLVSDHGMAAISADRAINLNEIAAPNLYRVIEDGPFASIEPRPGEEQALEKALMRPHEHMECWRRQDIPTRFEYGRNPRVSTFFCLAEVGWMITAGPPRRPIAGGTHGYDNASPEMAALFIANGPAIVPGATFGAFDNVAIAPLLRRLLGLPAAPDSQDSTIPYAKVIRP